MHSTAKRSSPLSRRAGEGSVAGEASG
jgi:hypothetical protein